MKTNPLFPILSLTLTLTALGSTPAFATAFDDSLEPTEVATAAIQCASEAKSILAHDEYLLSVSAKHRKVSGKVDEKSFVFQAARGGGWASPVEKTARLIATQRITQSQGEGNASVEWSCKVR